MFVLLVFHLVLGVAIIAAGRSLGRRGFALAGLAPLATVVWAITQADRVLDGEASIETFSWVGGLDIAIDLRLDAFALLMVALVSGIGLLICIYALGYFQPHGPDDVVKDNVGRLAGMMTLFAGAMLGVVLSDHLIALFIFWELTSITSYLLIGNDDTNPRARAAAELQKPGHHSAALRPSSARANVALRVSIGVPYRPDRSEMLRVEVLRVIPTLTQDPLALELEAAGFGFTRR